MLWYAIQTYTGKEEQLTEMIRRMAPKGSFEECFVPYFERLRNWRQQNQIHILRLFPGYVFLSTDDIGGVFGYLKKLPAMAKILTSEAFEFTPLYDSETEFLKTILDSDHIVRLTYASTDGKGHVTYMAGPLERCRERIQSYKFRDRYAEVGLTISGQEKTARMGLILNDDIRRETAYGKVEARIPTPEWNATAIRNPAAMPQLKFNPGDRVMVVNGAFEGNVAVIHKVKAGAVVITVRMFDREIPVEVAAEDVRKLEAEMDASPV